MPTPPPPPSKLLDQCRNKMRLKHYALSTERQYLNWIKRYILFHQKRHPKEMGASEVEAFLTHLAVEQHVSASTQTQALSALLFLYDDVLHQPLTDLNAVRARKPQRLPAVLSHAQATRLIAHLHGDPQLIAQLLYGAGLRLMECLRLRVKDLDFDRAVIIVRAGKGAKDRETILPQSLVEALRLQIAKVKVQHATDLKAGCGEVYLPDALAQKYPNASRQLAWQWLFPSRRLSTDPRSGKTMRHHLHKNTVDAAIRTAAQKIGVDKPIGPHTLRHSFATQLARSVPLPVLQQLLGHKDPRTTMIYVHLAEISGYTITSPLDEGQETQAHPS